MNWLDVVVAIVVVGMAAIGWKSGLVKAALIVVGVVLAGIVAAQISEPLSGALTSSVGSDSLATVIAYVIIGAAVFIAVQLLAGLIRSTLGKIKLGWLDIVGGFALGALGGLIIGAVLVAALARLAVLVPDVIDDFTPIDIRDGITRSLDGSAVVPAYLDIYDGLPASALGFIPGDFKDALAEIHRRDSLGNAGAIEGN